MAYLFDKINTSNILVLFSIILMLNLVALFCISLADWTDWAVIQGLVLDVSGAVTIAIPDVPGLKDRSTPKNLRKGWQKLIMENEIQRGDDGFSEILHLIEENTTRVRDASSFEKISVQNVANYGSRNVMGAGDVNDLSRFQLTETAYLKKWIDVERDRKFRISGLLLLGTGFSLQLIAYALQIFVVVQP